MPDHFPDNGAPEPEDMTTTEVIATEGHDFGTPRHQEQLSLAMGAVGALVGVVCSLLLFPGGTPLTGPASLRRLGSVVLAAVAGVAFLTTMFLTNLSGLPRRRLLGSVRQALDLVGLTTVHVCLTLLLTRAVLWVFSSAFVGLLLDRGSAAFVLALSSAVAAYAVSANATDLSTKSLATLMGGFMVVGSMASALSSSNPTWWHEHFSALGTVWDLSGFWFNFTLIVSGMVLITLADFLTHDLRRWSRDSWGATWRVTAIWLGFVVLGVFVALVGLVPVSTSLVWHTRFAYGVAYALAALVVAVPFLVGGMPKSFVAVSGVVVVVILAGRWLRSSGHVSTTGFEMIAVGMVFLWLLLLVRTVSAAIEEEMSSSAGTVDQAGAR